MTRVEAPANAYVEPSQQEVLCPLCDYDLRGLTEPRCPECGYRFDWSDLTDPGKKLHPYLFEHHPRQNARSFVRTMAGAMRPRRFWSSLKPSQPSRPGRLILYAIVVSLLLPLGCAIEFAHTAVGHVNEHEQMRSLELAQVTTQIGSYRPNPGDTNTFGAEVARVGGAQAYVDSMFPPPRSLDYVGYVYHRFYDDFGRAWESVPLLLAWPWLTLVTLMIFRASMRRAKVNGVHVLRCVVYTCDTAVPLGLIALLAVPPLVIWLDLGRYIGFRHTAVAAVVFAAVTTWRLAAAYRHYLQFHRPLATAAAAQAIVLLVTWVYLYAWAA